jgi:hypothetical protein
VKARSRAGLKPEQRQTNPTNRKKRSCRRSGCYKGDRSLDNLSAHSRTPVTKSRQRHFAGSWVRDRAFYSGTDVRRGAGQKVQLVQLKRQNRRVSMFARRLCLGSPGGEMSRQVLLATLARPLCEPSHRPPKKKDRPKSLSFCSDNTVTDTRLPLRRSLPVLPCEQTGQHRSVFLKGAATSRHRATTLG